MMYIGADEYLIEKQTFMCYYMYINCKKCILTVHMLKINKMEELGNNDLIKIILCEKNCCLNLFCRSNNRTAVRLQKTVG